MTDQELAEQLRSVRVPPRSPDYWEDFPSVIRVQLPSTGSLRATGPMRSHRFVCGGGFAYACLAAALLVGPFQCLLKTERAFRHEMAQVPAHLKSFMADEHGLHYLVSEKE